MPPTSSSSVTDPSSSTNLPLATLLHMITITIKLNSTNFLLWKNQLIPILESQDYLQYLDSTSTSTPLQIDQTLRMLLHSSLSEEAMAIVIGCKTTHEIWKSLETAYSHISESRELSLRADLQSLTKNATSVQDYARRFKAICDQLQAIGKPVASSYQSQWFLQGLGLEFAHFSTAQLALSPVPYFSDLVHRAEAHEIFTKNLSPAPPATTAYSTTTTGRQSNRGSTRSSERGSNYRRGTSSRRGSNRGYSRSSTRSYAHRCQLCGMEGHQANQCPYYVLTPRTANVNLAENFTANCSLSLGLMFQIGIWTPVLPTT